MDSKQRIEFDFNLARAQADRLEEIACELAGLSSNKFSGTLQNVSVNWKGENATQYINKGSKLQSQMTATAEELKSIADDLRRTSKRIYNAEMAALAIAEARTY